MKGLAQDGIARKYFARDSEGQIFLLVTASGQMTIDQATKCICNFRNAQLKKEFTESEDLSPFKLFAFNDEVKAELGEATPEDRSMLQQMKDSVHLVIDSVPEGGCSLIRTGLEKEMAATIKEVKIGWIAKTKKNAQVKSPKKTEYLKQFIIRIIEKFSKDSDEEIIDKIIGYGAIDPVITHPLFAMDQTFRQKLKNILYNCKTLKMLTLYRGEDIQMRRAEMADGLTECLIQLQFNEEAADAILNEFLKNPLTNIVANRTDLTNQQKESFYRSPFYRGEIIKNYVNILSYQQSIEFKAKEEIAQILKLIEDLGRKITRDILDCLLNYRLFSLLKVASIKNQKKNIFEFIVKNCPNYLKAFKLVNYQQKVPNSLGDNEVNCLKIELITIFQCIRLPFDEWQLAQDKIMSRKYSVLDELTLKQKEKHDLMQHIFAKIEPYFHRMEKEMSYRSQIEFILLQAIMATEISDANFDTILTIIQQTLDSQNYTSEQVADLPRRGQALYQGVLANPAFREYVGNNRRDVKEEQYARRWVLHRQIIENNLEDKIDVTYEAIDELIQKVVQEGKIPKTFHKYVTDLAKLRGDPIQPVEEEIPEESLPKQESVQELTIKFNEASQNLFRTYINQFPESLLASCLESKFGRNTSNLVRKMIESRVFTDQNTTFFSDLHYNPLITRRFRAEISIKVPTLTSGIQECTSIMKKLPSQGSQSNISPEHPVPNEAFKAKCAAFVAKYKSLNDDCNLDRLLKEKYQNDYTKLVQDLKGHNAFGNPESAFFSNVGRNPLLTRRVKMEFAKNAEWALKQLEALQ